jgi:hypothetical protein
MKNPKANKKKLRPKKNKIENQKKVKTIEN